MFYAHLDSVEEFSFWDDVEQGDILGTIGRSGVKAGTKAPHLHFEIFSDYTMEVKTKFRFNPAYFIDYEDVGCVSEEEKKLQVKEKNRGGIKEVNGKKKLIYGNIKNFQK